MPRVIINPNADGPVFSKFEVQPRGNNRPETMSMGSQEFIDGASPIVFEQRASRLYTMRTRASRTNGSTPETSVGFHVPKRHTGVLYLTGVDASDIEIELEDFDDGGRIKERAKGYLRPANIKVPGQVADSVEVFEMKFKVEAPDFVDLSVFTSSERTVLNRHAIMPQMRLDGMDMTTTAVA
jgi:hypothetical protein